MIVNNLNFDVFRGFSGRESKDFVDSDIIVVFLSCVITSAHTNASSCLVLVRNGYAAFVDGLGHRHMEALESVTVILHSLVEVGGENVVLAVLLALLDDRTSRTNSDLFAVFGSHHERLTF